MVEIVQLLAGTNLFLLAFSALIFDVPRYTLSLLSLALFGMENKRHASQLIKRFDQRDHSYVQRRQRT